MVYSKTVKTVTGALLGLTLLSACSNMDTGTNTKTSEAMATKMSFFITSAGPGDGANLGGLAGADAHCTSLAAAAGTHGQVWKAYLSTSGADGVNAKDRIGTGPWVNANGVTVATSVADLLSANNMLNKENSISESGVVINGRGDKPNRHDILTGTKSDGMAGEKMCANWTGNGEGSALVGHHDRDGGGSDPTSWSSAHGSRGCSQANLQSSGGDGLYYCFAQ